MKLLFKSVLVFFLCVFSKILTAQEWVDTSGFLPNITIDPIIIEHRKIDIPSFIKYIKTDTTFYKAFRNMRLRTFNAENDIKVYNSKGDVVASLQSETKQIYRDGCRTMNVLEEVVTGNFYKRNGNYRYFTAEMYAYLFFTQGKICNENNIVGTSKIRLQNSSGMEKRKRQLQQLIFNPGSRVDDIPFIGKKSSIFTDNMVDKYEYNITQTFIQSEECYLFEAKVLPKYQKDVVINYIKTWFRRSDFSIIKRDYSLSYSGLGYDFAVNMVVHIGQFGEYLLPTAIHYNGNVHVATQGREKVKFNAQFDY